MTISTVFINNRTQAVRIPVDLRMPEGVHKVVVRAKGSERIKAVYINSNRPITVELHQGGTVETLTQVQSWAKGAEYANPDTRWHVQDAAATLTRKGRKTAYIETD